MIVKNIKEFHKAVCLRENYTCEGCGKYFGYECFFLEDGRNSAVLGHHEDSQGSHPKTKLETDIGRCLCTISPNFCHQKVHNGELKLKKRR